MKSTPYFIKLANQVYEEGRPVQALALVDLATLSLTHHPQPHHSPSLHQSVSSLENQILQVQRKAVLSGLLEGVEEMGRGGRRYELKLSHPHLVPIKWSFLVSF